MTGLFRVRKNAIASAMGTTGTGTVVAVYHWQTEGEHHVPDGKNVSLARAHPKTRFYTSCIDFV